MPDLSYCNHCGAKLSRAKGDGVTKSSELRPETLVSAMAAVFIFGLGAIIGLMAVLKYVFDSRGDVGLIVFFTLLSFLIMLLVEGVFIWMLLRRKRSPKEVGDTKAFEQQAVKELDDAEGRMISEPELSVTDHTTRTLEPMVSRKTE
jgi:hypothetical protein